MSAKIPFGSIDDLLTGADGGQVTLDLTPDEMAQIAPGYAAAIRHLDKFAFWRMGAGEYRPDKGLRRPQRRAVAFAQAYLAAQRAGVAAGEAALIKMPTGTGKSGVIAAIACATPDIQRVLILTPRTSLVRQMARDVAIRFWRKLDMAFKPTGLAEGLSQADLDKLQAAYKGLELPVRSLIAGEYAKINEQSTWPRQIWVGTFNALHLLLGVEPPAHRSFYGREARALAASLSKPDANGQPGDPEAFRQLIKSVDLVIVDEGHHEPAYSWAQAVRELGKPTLIFTATPYRNDYKYFQIFGRFVFNLSWQESVERKLVRDVSIEALERTGPKDAAYGVKPFVRDIAAALKRLPAGKKAIVHAATAQSLMEIQRELYSQANLATVVIHDTFGKKGNKERDLKALPARVKEALAALRFSHTHLAQADTTAAACPVWLHQFKLLEGIDDDSFVEIWLYDGFGTARQLVQQIGRAIRLPDLSDANGQVAVVRGSHKRLDLFDAAPTVAERTASRWNDYLAFEAYARDAKASPFTAETQLIATLKRAAPGVQYVAGEFRGGHLLEEAPSLKAFIVPRRATVCRVIDRDDPVTDAFLDDLADKAAEAMVLEERFDIVRVRNDPDAPDVRAIRYLAWRNSPLLRSHQIPEWTLGVMLIVRAGRYVFLLDTEGNCLDHGRVHLTAPDPIELKRLFAASADGETHGLRIVETTAKGLDVSELGLRSISIRRHSLDSGYFDLAEASQTPTSIQGYSPFGDRTARRRLSLARSSVADATNANVSVRDFAAWAAQVAAIMADDAITPHAYFGRFAKEVPPPAREQGAPRSILLDLTDLVPEAGTDQAQGWDMAAVEKLLEADTCIEVTAIDNEDDDPTFVFEFAGHPIEIEYIHRDSIPPSGRYQLASDTLNGAISETAPDEEGADMDIETGDFGRRLAPSLTRLLNADQAFQIVTVQQGVVYSHGHFYRPEINEALIQILEGDKAVVGAVSEKGDTRVTKKGDWNALTLFGRVETWSKDTSGALEGLAADLAACEVLVCDDSRDETADFYALIPKQNRVLVIHAKASDTKKPTASARKLQEVVRQAQSSLALAGSARQAFPYPAGWGTKWSVTLKEARKAKIERPRVWKSDLTASQAHERIQAAIGDPLFTTEIVVLSAGLLGKAKAEQALKDRHLDDDQFLYFLAGVRTTFERAGVRFRIICNP